MLGKDRRVGASGKAAGGRIAPAERRDAKEVDYRCYHMRVSERFICLGKAVAFSAAVAWLFYRSIAGMAVVAVAWPMFCYLDQRAKTRERQQRLRDQFKECIRVVTGSVQAGYSVENAFAEAEKELVQLLGGQADFCRELHCINQQIRLNVPIEQLLEQLANRSGVEEIFSFGQVFGYAKRNGSDFVRILRDTAERIGEKAELEWEIHTLVAAKQLEQKIMNVIPLAILLFIDCTSPEFLQMMYEGMFGRVCMTICLLVYAGAYLLSARIVDIQV